MAKRWWTMAVAVLLTVAIGGGELMALPRIEDDGDTPSVEDLRRRDDPETDPDPPDPQPTTTTTTTTISGTPTGGPTEPSGSGSQTSDPAPPGDVLDPVDPSIVTETALYDSGERFPSDFVDRGGSEPDPAPGHDWIVWKGSRADQFIDDVGGDLESAFPPGDPGADAMEFPRPNPFEPPICPKEMTGIRDIPKPQIQAFRSEMFTPVQNTWLLTSGPSSDPWLPQLETRMDPNGTGIRQFKVEAHLLSPTIFAGDVYADMNMVQGHIVVDEAGRAPRSYFAGSPGTEFNKLCYAQDKGRFATRGYVEAWIPFESSPNDPAREPGFQVRFEAVDNNGFSPSAFVGADQHTIHVGPMPDKGIPLTLPQDDSVGVSVKRNLLVDDLDGVPNIEAALTQPLIDGITNGLQGFSYHINDYSLDGEVTINHPGTFGLDVDLAPIPSPVPGAPPTGEARLKVNMTVENLKAHGYIFPPLSFLPCGFQGQASGSVTATATVKVGTPDRSELGVDVAVNVDSLRVYDLFVSPVPLLCNGAYVILAQGIQNSIREAANEKIAEVLTNELGDTFDLGIRDALLPGWTAANGNGFVSWFDGFTRTCQPYGCLGGDVALTTDSLGAAAKLAFWDRKGFGTPRRFDWIHRSTVRPMSEVLTSNVTGGGNYFEAALFVHPNSINGLLKAVTEGAPGQLNGFLDTEFDLGTTRYKVSPEVAPVLLPQVPGLPALTVLIPDVRIEGGGNEFLVTLAVGLELRVDAATRKVTPNIRVGAVFNTMTCTASAGALLISYGLCANTTWMGGTGPRLPSVPDILNTIANKVVPELIANSIGQVEVPPVMSGFDPLSLGSIEVGGKDGMLALYFGVRNGPNPPPKIHVGVPPAPTGLTFVGSGCCPTYGDYTWNKVPGATAYEVEMEGYAGGGCVVDGSAFMPGATNRGRVQSHAFCLGSKYNVRIRAQRDGLWGPWSPILNIRL